jgi:hypothetical protein
MMTTASRDGRDDCQGGQLEPDIRGLGLLSLLAAAASALLAVSYFYSPFTYLAAAVAAPLSVMARGDQRSRTMGTIALAVAAAAAVWATVTLVVLF